MPHAHWADVIAPRLPTMKDVLCHRWIMPGMGAAERE